jgi:hypothetical protein
VDSRVRVGSELSTWGLADAGSVAHRWVPLKWVIARDLRVGSEGIFFFFVRPLAVQTYPEVSLILPQSCAWFGGETNGYIGGNLLAWMGRNKEASRRGIIWFGRCYVSAWFQNIGSTEGQIPRNRGRRRPPVWLI